MQILTQSGGLVEMAVTKSAMIGTRLVLHIDQTLNIRNGEGDASIAITVDECKGLIAGLNEFIKLMDGEDYVYTSESVVNLLSHPAIQAKLKSLEDNGEIDKLNPEDLEKVERLLK